MPMMTTMLFSNRATSPAASMRGVTNRRTGLIPSTSIASISSRMVRDPRSAHIAVAPAPATINTVTTGPTCVTAPNAAPAPERSAAPNSRSRMFSVKLTNTVNGMATRSVGANDTLATNHDCSTNSRHWNGRTNMNLTASTPIENNPPTACDAPDNPLGSAMPADHRSGPLTAIGPGSFQDSYCRDGGRTADVVRQCDSRSVDLVHSFSAELLEQLDSLCHTGGPRRVAFGL